MKDEHIESVEDFAEALKNATEEASELGADVNVSTKRTRRKRTSTETDSAGPDVGNVNELEFQGKELAPMFTAVGGFIAYRTETAPPTQEEAEELGAAFAPLLSKYGAAGMSKYGEEITAVLITLKYGLPRYGQYKIMQEMKRRDIEKDIPLGDHSNEQPERFDSGADRIGENDIGKVPVKASRSRRGS